MSLLPRPPWARPRERCPNCLAKTPDERALVCDRCGYQLRLPFVAVAGLGLIAAGIASFLAYAFMGWILPWPAMPFGIKIPFLENPSPADLSNLALWLGGILLAAGVVAAYSGAYVIRRQSDRVLARSA